MTLKRTSAGLLFAAAIFLVTIFSFGGCTPAVEPDEPIRTSNPVDGMKSDINQKLSAGEDRFKWYSYNDALEIGRKENKYVMVVFYTDWCKWCKKLKEETTNDPAVSTYLRDNFAVARVNAESSSTVIYEMRKVSMIELAEAYGVTQFPTVWFLEPNGARAKALNGYLPPEDFLVYLKYINTGSYRMSE